MAFKEKMLEKKENNGIITLAALLRYVQWNLDLVTDLVIQKSVTKSWVVTKSMYFKYY